MLVAVFGLMIYIVMRGKKWYDRVSGPFKYLIIYCMLLVIPVQWPFVGIGNSKVYLGRGMEIYCYAIMYMD